MSPVKERERENPTFFLQKSREGRNEDRERSRETRKGKRELEGEKDEVKEEEINQKV